MRKKQIFNGMKKNYVKVGERYEDWIVLKREKSFRNPSGKMVSKVLCKCKCGKNSNVEIWKLIKRKIKYCNSCSKLGHIPWNKNTKGLMPIPWNKGKPWPENSGENHPNWVKDRTKLQKYGDDNLDRRSSAYTYWKRQVLKRDKKCRIDNKDCEGRLEVHHILGWKEYVELRYEINNGITLCHFHHPRRKSEEIRLSPYFQELVTKIN